MSKKRLEIRATVEVDENVDIVDFYDTVESVLSFGADEVIDECIPYEYTGVVEVMEV